LSKADSGKADSSKAGFRTLDNQPPAPLLDAHPATAPAPEQRALTLIQGLASTADQLLDGDRETAAFPGDGTDGLASPLA
jgi:hypothetical protein